MEVEDSINQPNQVRDEAAVRFQELFTRFLKEFHEPDSTQIKYMSFIEDMAQETAITTLNVSLADIEIYNEQLSEAIITEYYRVLPYLQAAAESILVERGGEETKREVYVAFHDSKNKKNIRQMRADDIGMLSALTGQVVRTHPVLPELIKGVFTCDECGTEQPPVTQQFTYTLPQVCVNNQCANRTRIQEVHDELPRGSIPRAIDVIVRGDAVEQAQAGDRVLFTGTLIVVPEVGSMVAGGNGAPKQLASGGSDNAAMAGVTGLKSLGVRELNYRFAYLAYAAQPIQTKATGSIGAKLMASRNDEAELTQEEIAEYLEKEDWTAIQEMLNDQKLLGNMCKSMFPSIHGHEDVKKGIILMLMGGVPKKTSEGTQLRGDLNVCLVGDPSTAKSQMLKTIENFSPKCVYTSGKASSAAGLTAAVVKDEESGEFTIEAGALLLADNGVCCIDEFDKMDIKDQVAIHEAMEQQTITITKAGVKATLKARTSILAAANPVGGRYDKSKQLRHNISLTAPIMSRFDLFFVMVDEANEMIDYQIAQSIGPLSIVDLHSHNIAERFEHNKIYPVDLIRKYLLWAKLTNPEISDEAEKVLIKEYREMRKGDAGGNSTSWRITVRQLESLIRLSEGIARLYAKDKVQANHVREAAKLLSRSIVTVEMPDVEWEEEIDLEGLDLDENDMNDEVDQGDVEADKENVNPTTGQNSQEKEKDNNSELLSDLKQSESISEPPKKTRTEKFSMSYREFQDIRILLLREVRHKEEIIESTTEEDAMPDAYTRDSLNEWFLEHIEDILDPEEGVDIDEEKKKLFSCFDKTDLIQRKKILGRIVDKLVNDENSLVELETEPLAGEERGVRILVINPNCVLDGDF